MEDKEKKNVMSAGDNLTGYMETVIADLEKEGKFPAAHIYRSVLHSFIRFGILLYRCEVIRHQCRTSLHRYRMSLHRNG